MIDTVAHEWFYKDVHMSLFALLFPRLQSTGTSLLLQMWLLLTLPVVVVPPPPPVPTPAS
jgi:hypothetical protein